MINGDEPQVYEFPSDVISSHHLAIPGVSKNGHVWVTSHQARRAYQFDPEAQQYLKTWPLQGEWPIDVIGDDQDVVWVSILNKLERDTGGLAKIDYMHGSVTTYRLPQDGAYGYWLANDFQRYVYVTASGDGVFRFDKTTEQFTHIVPVGKVFYRAIATNTLGKKVAMGNSLNGALSIDVLDTERLSIRRYPLPIPQGMVKEGLELDTKDQLWGCQAHSNVIFHLDLSDR
jgi:streptogramin lyase